MNMNSRPVFASVFIFALVGCVGPVEIAPLPYAHPAHPDTPSGETFEIGTALRDQRSPSTTNPADEPNAPATSSVMPPKPSTGAAHREGHSGH